MLLLRMVSTIRYIFLFLLPLLISGCGKNEFSIEFNLAEDITDNFSTTYYASTDKGGITVQAVASVREGKCILECSTKNPTLVYITARRSKLPLVVYAEKGNKIMITGEGLEPLAWNVEGNEIDLALSEWRKENFDNLKAHLTDSINGDVKAYVENNPDNPVATILMLSYFDRKENEREYTDLMASLKGKARNEDLLKLLARTDQMYHSYSYPARLESIVMKSDNKGGDTIRLNGRNPVLMAFWQSGYGEKKKLTDSIKQLEKDYPDTARIIADVYLDVDSTAWRVAIKKDSFENVKRFWAPMGLTHPTIMKLKVNTVPFFIVFDKEGHQEYRGDNLSDAIEEYRKLQALNDTLK